MPTRNTPVLQQIIQALGDLIPAPAEALARLEEHFESDLLIVAGTTSQVAAHAETLRLAITTSECALVLDYIGHEAMAGITLDHTETAINTLLGDRFIEPGPQ